nr:hypothetical protein [uncultured Rhodopila sp.]
MDGAVIPPALRLDNWRPCGVAMPAENGKFSGWNRPFYTKLPVS